MSTDSTYGDQITLQAIFNMYNVSFSVIPTLDTTIFYLFIYFFIYLLILYIYLYTYLYTYFSIYLFLYSFKFNEHEKRSYV